MHHPSVKLSPTAGTRATSAVSTCVCSACRSDWTACRASAGCAAPASRWRPGGRATTAGPARCSTRPPWPRCLPVRWAAYIATKTLEHLYKEFPSQDRCCPRCAGPLLVWPATAQPYFLCLHPGHRGRPNKEIRNTGANQLSCYTCDYSVCMKCVNTSTAPSSAVSVATVLSWSV